MWDFKTAKKLSKEVQVALKEDSYNLLKNMWGDTPSKWNSKLVKYKRFRVIINYFTRMRFLDKKGALKLKKKNLKSEKNHIPWFDQTTHNLKEDESIVFGHWASLQALDALPPAHNVYHVDNGCAWGRELTALRLDDQQYFSVAAVEAPAAQD